MSRVSERVSGVEIDQHYNNIIELRELIYNLNKSAFALVKQPVSNDVDSSSRLRF